VHGIGVIAIRDIKKGETVYADRMPAMYTISYEGLGNLFPEVKKIILERWPSIINGSQFIHPDARLVSFMNHSKESNYDPETDTALKDILAGEEIVEDYTSMKNWERVWTPEENSWIDY